MKNPLRSFYYQLVLVLIGVVLLSIFWEFYLEDLVVPHVYEFYHPEPLYERVEYVIVSLFFVVVALIVPARLTSKSIREAEQARASLAAAYNDLENRVQARTRELSEANEKLKSTMVERLEYELALRESEKELKLLASQLLTAQEKERRRVALDLHDNVSQTLSAMKWKVEHALNEYEGSSKKTTELANLLVPVIQETIEEVRNMYMRLRPSILDDLGLAATLTWLWRDFNSSYPDVHIHREIDIAEDDISDNLKIVIYRVVQEGLNNVARHSKADQVHVTLNKQNNAVELTLRDNGVGFSMEEVLSVDDSLRGMGLSGMRERIELSGGIFRIDSEKGAGTKITASWPVEHDQSG